MELYLGKMNYAQKNLIITRDWRDKFLNDVATVDTYSEKCHRASTFESSVGDLCLFREIGRVLDRRDHSLDGEERGQVGRVRGDDDQREEPPDSTDDSRAGCLIMTIDTLHKGRSFLPLSPPPLSRGQFLLGNRSSRWKLQSFNYRERVGNSETTSRY